jgi:hypothetical protein
MIISQMGVFQGDDHKYIVVNQNFDKQSLSNGR